MANTTTITTAVASTITASTTTASTTTASTTTAAASTTTTSVITNTINTVVRRSAWWRWGRWLLMGLILFLALAALLGVCCCLMTRKRKKARVDAVDKRHWNTNGNTVQEVKPTYNNGVSTKATAPPVNTHSETAYGNSQFTTPRTTITSPSDDSYDIEKTTIQQERVPDYNTAHETAIYHDVTTANQTGVAQGELKARY